MSNEIKSKINGKGYGSCHTWIRTKTFQWYKIPGWVKDKMDSGKFSRSDYICNNCEATFSHYYDSIPNIFEAIKSSGIPNQCFDPDTRWFHVGQQENKSTLTSKVGYVFQKMYTRLIKCPSNKILAYLKQKRF